MTDRCETRVRDFRGGEIVGWSDGLGTIRFIFDLRNGDAVVENTHTGARGEVRMDALRKLPQEGET